MPGEAETADKSPRDYDAPVGDEANLEYANKATSLVLERLSDQRENPDERLLEKLGWTADELRSFVDRWQKLKRTARESEVDGRALDDRLRGLGLRPPNSRVRRGNRDGSRQGGLRESGAVSPPPAAYREQFDAFRKSRAKVKGHEET
jgi:hypothetical protein